MDGSFSKLSPLIFITLFCLGSVEIGYLAIERYVLKLPVKTETGRKSEKGTGIDNNEKKIHTKNIQLILKRNLFGAPDSDKSSKEPPRQVETNIEASDLEIILMGTANDGINGNRAFILDKKSRKQKIYKVGDAIEGALIDIILRGKVILSSDGKNEVLDMSEAAKIRSNYRSLKKSRAVRPKPKVVRPKRRVDTQNLPSKRKRRVVAPEIGLDENFPQ